MRRRRAWPAACGGSGAGGVSTGRATARFTASCGAPRRCPPALRAATLSGAAEAAFLQCDYAQAGALLHEALTVARAGGDGEIEAIIVHRLGSIAREQGRYDEAEAHHRDALARWEAAHDIEGAARARTALGFVSWLRGRPEQTEEFCAPALSDFGRAGLEQQTAETLVHLGAAATYLGANQSARELLESALETSRRIRFAEGTAWALHELAILARRRRRPVEESAAALSEALQIHHRLGDRWRSASVLEEIGIGPGRQAQPGLAVTLLAAAAAVREEIGAPVPPAEAGDHDQGLERLRARLADAEFTESWAAGRALDLDTAVDAAIAGLQRFLVSGGNSSGAALTGRELAVLRLMSQGQTNREIGAALHISPSTAGVHVSNILRKLGSRRRADAVARGIALGLLDRAQ